MTPRARLNCVLCRAALSHGVTLSDVLGRARTHKITQARFDCYRAMRERSYSTSQIARRMDRDPSTVSHGLARVSELQLNLL